MHATTVLRNATAKRKSVGLLFSGRSSSPTLLNSKLKQKIAHSVAQPSRIAATILQAKIISSIEATLRAFKAKSEGCDRRCK